MEPRDRLETGRLNLVLAGDAIERVAGKEERIGAPAPEPVRLSALNLDAAEAVGLGSLESWGRKRWMPDDIRQQLDHSRRSVGKDIDAESSLVGARVDADRAADGPEIGYESRDRLTGAGERTLQQELSNQL